ncbi:Nodulin-like / Major Facilitator Superfamily protein [Prunus dulcis]|uniref:Nodulin-like / Major Facilitator Superfamily protein n=1 Tax=Prunus dulcis TaxID=3755 RepID=A0A4Y1RHX2_PRUDU|nr:Nodulin-like / Major Facilitator Superfamily protein [Prunus dulcis]
MKGFLGLSGAILFQIYWTFLYKKPASFLLMLALLPTINTLLLMWFVRIHKKYEGNEKKHLNKNLLTLCLAIRVVAFVALILLLASPLCIAIRARQGESNRVSQTLLAEGDQLIDGESNWRDTEKSHIQDPSGYRHLPSNNTDRELDSNDRTLQSGEILIWSKPCALWTSGFCLLPWHIGGSRAYRTFEKSTLISLWSIWNFLGRFGAGYVSDHFLHLRGWARPLFIVITLAGMSIGHVVIASGMPCALYTGSLLVGVFYGSQWSLMPTITSEIFGVLHMGTIFNAITIAAPVGSYIFSVRVIRHIYDKEASTAWNTCTGAHCFRLSFLIMACATFLGSLTALALFFRTISFYSQDIDGTSNT